ncbi:putative CALMODULIN-BINDING PROTEIN60 [Helianthus anomalus]
MSEREGKRRMLQGNTCLQPNKGVCYVPNKISFTHSAEHTRNSMYRLVAVVVDAYLMNGVELSTTEAFVMKDRCYIYKVCYLKQIGYKGPRYTRLKDRCVHFEGFVETTLHESKTA